jgi:hypothetical protein
VLAVLLIVVASVKVVVAIEPDFPKMSPEMVQGQFEPSVAGLLFLGVDVGVVHDVSSLNLSPLFAESSFEKVLPSDFVLGVDKGSAVGPCCSKMGA